jgi:hypothetical protein
VFVNEYGLGSDLGVLILSVVDVCGNGVCVAFDVLCSSFLP